MWNNVQFTYVTINYIAFAYFSQLTASASADFGGMIFIWFHLQSQTRTTPEPRGYTSSYSPVGPSGFPQDKVFFSWFTLSQKSRNDVDPLHPLIMGFSTVNLQAAGNQRCGIINTLTIGSREWGGVVLPIFTGAWQWWIANKEYLQSIKIQKSVLLSGLCGILINIWWK